MSFRRIAVPAVVAWLVDSVYGYVVFGVMLDNEFAPFRPTVFRATAEMNSMLPLMFISSLIAFVALAYIFAKGHEGGPGLKEGFWFGVVFGAYFAFAVAIPSYAIYNISQKLAAEMAVCTFVEVLISGLVLGLVYKPAPGGASARAARV
jgi:hypothetical protein